MKLILINLSMLKDFPSKLLTESLKLLLIVIRLLRFPSKMPEPSTSSTSSLFNLRNSLRNILNLEKRLI